MSYAHLTLATQDAAKTADFFEATLRWKRLEMPANIDVTAIWMDIGSGQQVHILQIEGFEVSPFEKEYGRHVAFFHDRADWLSLQERIREAKSDVVPPLRETPFPRFFFHDPNGYLIEVIERESFCDEVS